MEIKATALMRSGDTYQIATNDITRDDLKTDASGRLLARVVMHPYTHYSGAMYRGTLCFEEAELELMLKFLREKRLQRLEEQIQQLSQELDAIVSGGAA